MRLQPIHGAALLTAVALTAFPPMTSHAVPPMQSASQMVRSEEALNAGNYQEAVQRLDALIASGDLDKQGLQMAYVNRGIAWQKIGDNKKARSDYDAALKRSEALPSAALVKAYYNRGILLSASGDVRGAIRDYDAAIRIDPAYAAAYHNRANIARKSGDNAAAVRDYTAALTYMKGDGRKYTLLGRALSQQQLGNAEAAKVDLEQALAIDPNLPGARMALDSVSGKSPAQLAMRQDSDDNIVTASLGPTAAASSREQTIRIGSNGGWETVAVRFSSDIPPQVANAAPSSWKTEVKAANATAAETTSTATPPAKEVRGYRVQLASLRSAEIAEDTWNKLQSNNDLLSNLPHQVNQADLGERGIYYRLQVGGFASISEAKALCNDLGSRKIDCIVVR